MGKIDKEVIEQIPVLYKKYGVKAKVAKELGISASTVSKYLNLYAGAAAANGPKKRVRVTPEMIEQINILYAECLNMSQVAREVGVSNSTVKRYLNEENLKKVKNQYDDRDALFFYIIRLFGINSEEEPVSAHNLTLMQKYKAKGYPYRGQLLTLKYFYEVERHPIKEEYKTIGIIEYVYERARQYYHNQAKKADEIGEAIERQLQKDRLEIKYDPKNYFNPKKKKKMIDLNTLGE